MLYNFFHYLLHSPQDRFTLHFPRPSESRLRWRRVVFVTETGRKKQFLKIFFGERRKRIWHLQLARWLMRLTVDVRKNVLAEKSKSGSHLYNLLLCVDVSYLIFFH